MLPEPEPHDFLGDVDKDRLKQFLVRGWMTHDAMWFVHSVHELGIETANRLNRAAVRSMAQVEAKRLLRILGRDAVTSFDELREFFEAARQLVMGDFMDFVWRWSEDERSVRFEMRKCFAYDGVSQLGVADRYECGIYERVYGWLAALGVEYSVEPDVSLCTMHHAGECVRRLELEIAAPV
jgi:hypothetical protein